MDENKVQLLESAHLQMRKDIENLQKEVGGIKEKQEDFRVSQAEMKLDLKTIKQTQEEFKEDQKEMKMEQRETRNDINKLENRIDNKFSGFKEEMMKEMRNSWDDYRKDIIKDNKNYKNYLVGAIISGLVVFVFAYLGMR